MKKAERKSKLQRSPTLDEARQAMEIKSQMTSRTSGPFGASSASLSNLVDAALVVAERRRDILSDLRASLKGGENERALELARVLCGLEDYEQKSDRARSRIN